MSKESFPVHGTKSGSRDKGTLEHAALLGMDVERFGDGLSVMQTNLARMEKSLSDAREELAITDGRWLDKETQATRKKLALAIETEEQAIQKFKEALSELKQSVRILKMDYREAQEILSGRANRTGTESPQ